MRFLVVFRPSSLEDWTALIRVVTEHTLRRRLEVGMITTELVMIVDLIKGVLISKKFVLCKANVVPLGIEFVGLFGRKVLTPTPGVVPMMVGFQSILGLSRNDNTVFELVIVTHELAQIAAFESTFQNAHIEVSLSHLFFFFSYVEDRAWFRTVSVSLLRRRHELFRSYRNNKVRKVRGTTTSL